MRVGNPSTWIVTASTYDYGAFTIWKDGVDDWAIYLQQCREEKQYEWIMDLYWERRLAEEDSLMFKSVQEAKEWIDSRIKEKEAMPSPTITPPPMPSVEEDQEQLTNMDIKQAAELMHGGECVRRAGWGGNFLFYDDDTLQIMEASALEEISWVCGTEDLLATDWEVVGAAK